MKYFNDRAQILFTKLMSLYLNDGKPVGSSVIAKQTDIGVSPATIRNVMADLEKLGLIHSPHTSAGRVPTERGLRIFVDSLMTCQPVKKPLQTQIQQSLLQSHSQDELMTSASKVLSSLTGMTSFVLLPSKEKEVLRHIDFVVLGDQRVLVVLLLNDNDIQNRIIELEHPPSASELEQVANYLNRHFVGKSLSQAKQELLARLTDLRQQMNQVMVSIIEATDQAMEQKIQAPSPFLMAGQSKLLDYAELGSSEKLKALFESFEQHSQLLQLMDKSLQAKGVQIYIGAECGSELYQGCSVITSPYESDGEVLGVLGVIGPTRMAYDKIVPRIDMTAKILSRILQK